MSEPIKPALTAEQWTGDHTGPSESHGVLLGWMTRRHAGKSTAIVEFGHEMRVLVVNGGSAELDRAECHALAALCLYQQSFGFKPFHVALLRVVADTIEPIGEDERAEELRWLAARIAALLPPEERAE